MDEIRGVIRDEIHDEIHGVIRNVICDEIHGEIHNEIRDEIHEENLGGGKNKLLSSRLGWMIVLML